MLTDYDIKVLREIAGEPQEDLRWGAAMSAAIETLWGHGLVTRSFSPKITDAGREYLERQAA